MLFVGQLKNADDVRVALAALGRTTAGFVDTPYLRFIENMPRAMFIGKFGLGWRREEVEPFLFRPLLVDVDMPNDQALQSAIQHKDGMLDVLLSPNDAVHAAQIAAEDMIARAGSIAEEMGRTDMPPRRLVEEAMRRALSEAREGNIARLVDEARVLNPPYAAVVMDLPPTQTEWNIQPLMRATAVILVAEPSLSDQVNAIETLNILTGVLDPRYRVPKEAIYIVLNRVTDRDPLTPNAFRDGIESKLGWAPPVIARIPHDPDVRRAQLNFQAPVVSVEDFREGIDQIVAFFFPNLSGVKPKGKVVNLGGVRIRLRK